MGSSVRRIVRLRALDAKIVKGVKEKKRGGREEWEGSEIGMESVYIYVAVGRQYGAL